mmetsp:Transcript_45135/g.118414  ORF Transcript_45135/g.118414 Transcript_45135/m.118414 type:complete len:220 (-) Transcript_45135:901-1560(-)
MLAVALVESDRLPESLECPLDPDAEPDALPLSWPRPRAEPPLASLPLLPPSSRDARLLLPRPLPTCSEMIAPAASTSADRFRVPLIHMPTVPKWPMPAAAIAPSWAVSECSVGVVWRLSLLFAGSAGASSDEDVPSTAQPCALDAVNHPWGEGAEPPWPVISTRPWLATAAAQERLIPAGARGDGLRGRRDELPPPLAPAGAPTAAGGSSLRSVVEMAV